jgi:CheY-like chemotaxis protein
VLLVDDHVRILESVAKELAVDFEIVAMVTDGQQALIAADRLEPDLIVLDVAMPGLDGFQTLRQLKRNGTRAKIVMLTMYESDEYVAKAIDCEAHGYALKTRIRLDLVNALKHALADQFLVPQISPVAAAGRAGHAVLCYADEQGLLDAGVGFLTTALGRGDSVALFLTDEHRRCIAKRLQQSSLTELEREGRYLTFDARESASQIVRDARLDVDSVAEMADRLERARLASSRGRQSRMTIFGEISALLCHGGNREAAIQLEQVWDDLTRSLPFLTLCAYPVNGATLSHICAEHSVVSRAANAA